jgi:hypothetical protein
MWCVMMLACVIATGPAPVLDCPPLWARQASGFDSREAVSKRAWQEPGYDAHCVNTDMLAPK